VHFVGLIVVNWVSTMHGMNSIKIVLIAVEHSSYPNRHHRFIDSTDLSSCRVELMRWD
jgi:hypothetical protein